MDRTALVNVQIEEGNRLLRALRHPLQVTTAFWAMLEGDDQWYLYIATSLVDRLSGNQAYRRAYSIFRSMTPPLALDPFQIKLISPSETIASEIARRPEHNSTGSWVGPRRIADQTVDGVFVYSDAAPQT